MQSITLITLDIFVIDDPTALVPGSDLPGREWSLLNHFHSGTGRCAASAWRYTDNPLCICVDFQLCRTSWTTVQWTSSKVVLQPFTTLLILL